MLLGSRRANIVAELPERHVGLSCYEGMNLASRRRQLLYRVVKKSKRF